VSNAESCLLERVSSAVNDELLQRLDDLRAEAALLSAQLAWVSAGTHTAQDTSGSVSLALNGDSAVAGFKLDPGWRRQLAPEALSSAILEAYANATKAAMEACARRANQLVEGGEIPNSERPPVPTSQLAPPSREEAAAFARKLHDAVNEADERMSEFQDLVAGPSRNQSRVSSSTGMVRLILSNGVLSHVDVNERWLRETADSSVEKELGSVLRSALPGISQQARQAAISIPAIGAVLAAASRPADLLRQLGLTS
jgi:DNA-binding protein YbaB